MFDENIHTTFDDKLFSSKNRLTRFKNENSR